jgi:hypothetical protein
VVRRNPAAGASPTPVPPEGSGSGRAGAGRRPVPQGGPGAPGECSEHAAVEQVAADLRRLARELAAVPAGAPYVRWQALQNAYDRVLVEAAELLEVPHELAEVPVAGTAHDIERLRVVCALEAAGLVMEG